MQGVLISSPVATTLFVLGLDKGMRFIESWTNAAALFIVREPDGLALASGHADGSATR